MEHILRSDADISDDGISLKYSNETIINDNGLALSEGIIKNLNISSGHIQGLILHDNMISINAKVYKNLEIGHSENIVASYNLLESSGAEIPQTAFFKVTGTENGPEISLIL